MHEVERIFRQAYRSNPGNALRSPPDVFAVCATFVKLTGAYRQYASGSTPERRASVRLAIDEGAGWRKLIDSHPSPRVARFPETIRTSWGYIAKNISRGLSALLGDQDFTNSCLFLIVAADEACAGIGIPSEPGGNYFELDAEAGIHDRGTLCRNIPAESLRVLPKQHTPQSGFNIRSLTHHLAFLTASEVTPDWTLMPHEPSRRTSFNVLMAPWPLRIYSSEIRPASRVSHTSQYGYFEYCPQAPDTVGAVKKWVENLFSYAKMIGQEIDLLLFPECALTVKQWLAVSKVAKRHGASVISGVRDHDKKSAITENTLRIKTPYDWQPEYKQFKHHRWQIDGTQISNYGLGGTLCTQKSWWENINIQKRALRFIASREELVLCPLICEDLARQDPVAELVRSVGPNLVVALLMDGPQLAERWSARYATVLADDPGSSVLTISSLGMVELSRPNNCKPSRIIGSWKDPFSAFTPLELADGQDGLILNLQFRKRVECTIDGREDGGVASTPVLCGIHPVKERALI